MRPLGVDMASGAPEQHDARRWRSDYAGRHVHRDSPFVARATALVLKQLSIINGLSVNDASGGIVNHGTLTSQPGRCRKTSPSTAAAGSSATVGGTLTVDDSTLSGNNAFWLGGGIWSTSKTLTVRNLRDFEGEWIGY
jgi:hypothetical protein